MKLVAVLSTENHKNTLRQLFIRKKISVFSELNVNGFRPVYHEGFEAPEKPEDVNLHPVFSILSFAFVTDSQAKELIRDIDLFNNKQTLPKPVHAFQLDVDRFVG
ncbi:MAG: hypothetical protein MI921_08875 [Cytophagales bacterium]|nr:hypothetical protein [Cytophagales bacterium]